MPPMLWQCCKKAVFASTATYFVSGASWFCTKACNEFSYIQYRLTNALIQLQKIVIKLPKNWRNYDAHISIYVCNTHKDTHMYIYIVGLELCETIELCDSIKELISPKKCLSYISSTDIRICIFIYMHISTYI